MADPQKGAAPIAVVLADGGTVPLHLIPFDHHGLTTAPVSRAHLLDAAAGGDHTHFLIFSHGWNTDWQGATRLYARYVRQLFDVLADFPTMLAETFRPLLVGIFWPSVTLVAPWESPPRMAGSSDHDIVEQISELSELLGADGPRLRALLGTGGQLDAEEVRTLASLLAPLYRTAAADAETLPELNADRVVALWRAVAVLDVPLAFDEAGYATAPAGLPQMAGNPVRLLLSPRVVIRTTSVWAMKDRAATVGAAGVRDLLADLLATAPQTPVHVVGHSFGAKVMLSALCAGGFSRQISSALLLQPAVSCYCFANHAPGAAGPGGYRPAMRHVRQPIWATFSAADQALAIFQYFLRRPEDLGEQRIADGAPDPFAALGYVGPHGLGSGVARVPVPFLGVGYPSFGSSVQLVAIEAHQAITDHNDITNPHAAWMLWQQMQR